MGSDGPVPAARRVAIGRIGDVTTLNPVLYGDLGTGEVVNRLFDHLVITDDDGAFVPGRLLARWSVSDDGLVWDFHLRPDARWHDGRPVTAHDACFTLEAMLDPATRSPRRSEFVVDGEPIAFRAVEPTLLRITLPGRFAPFLAALAWRPLIPAHLFAGSPIETNPHNWAPVGSGPFEFGHWEPGVELGIRAHERHHLGRPALDRVDWRCFPGGPAAVEALLAGDVDYVPGVPPALVRVLEDEHEVRVLRSLDGSFTYLGFQLEHPLFRDVRVRRAIHAAVDRDRIVRQALAGEGIIATTAVVPSSPWHNPHVSSGAHDPRAAAELLEAAGWRIGPDGVRTDAEGRPLEFTIRTLEHDPAKGAAARLIADQLAAVGVTARIACHPMGELLELYARTGGFEALLLGLTPGLDPAFLHGFYHSAMRPPGGWNLLRYRNPVVDAVLDRSQRAGIEAERRELVFRAQAEIAADVPHVLLYHAAAVDATRARLVLPGLPATPANRFMYLHRWSVTTELAADLGNAKLIPRI
jgi:peptide/nickel transport system substrate-binding protein